MTSCATIMNQPYKKITIYTTEPSKIIYNQNTITTSDNKADLSVLRKKETLRIIATTDSLTKSIEVEPRNSFMYWSNIFFNYGIGMSKNILPIRLLFRAPYQNYPLLMHYMNTGIVRTKP